MKCAFFKTALFIAAAPIMLGHASELNHYAPAIYGTRDFFVPSDPGLYYSQINFTYLSDQFNDGDGNAFSSLSIPGSLDLSRTISGAGSFSLASARGSSFSFNYQGSRLDVAGGFQRNTTTTATVSLDAEIMARLRTQSVTRITVEDLDVRTTGIVPTVVWSSDTKVLGGRLGGMISLPIVDMSIDARLKATTDIKGRLDGRLTARAVAQLTAQSTVDGTITITDPDGNRLDFSGGQTFNTGATVGGTVSQSFREDFSVQHESVVEIQDSSTALGDLFVQPVWVGWGGDHYDLSISDGFFAPTGRYEAGALDNTGMGFWSNLTTVAGAWYPFKSRGTAITAAAAYEVHSNREGVDIRPGDNFTISWGFSQFLPLNKSGTLLADLGVSGYSIFQVSDDTGRDVVYDASIHDEVHAYGIQGGLLYVPWNATMTIRWLHEFGARDRFVGDMYVLNFAKKIW
ncbi:MAG: transporter [Verrucomicrobiae bacterium]|nr:transporter [Verrucomicrobiae bacterium]